MNDFATVHDRLPMIFVDTIEKKKAERIHTVAVMTYPDPTESFSESNIDALRLMVSQ